MSRASEFRILTTVLSTIASSAGSAVGDPENDAERVMRARGRGLRGLADSASAELIIEGGWSMRPTVSRCRRWSRTRSFSGADPVMLMFCISHIILTTPDARRIVTSTHAGELSLRIVIVACPTIQVFGGIDEAEPETSLSNEVARGRGSAFE